MLSQVTRQSVTRVNDGLIAGLPGLRGSVRISLSLWVQARGDPSCKPGFSAGARSSRCHLHPPPVSVPVQRGIAPRLVFTWHLLPLLAAKQLSSQHQSLERLQAPHKVRGLRAGWWQSQGPGKPPTTQAMSSADSGSWAGRARAGASPCSAVICSKRRARRADNCYLYGRGRAVPAFLVLAQKQRETLVPPVGAGGGRQGAGARGTASPRARLHPEVHFREGRGGERVQLRGCRGELLLLHGVALAPPAPRSMRAVARPPWGALAQLCRCPSPEWAEPGCWCLGAAAPAIPAGSWQTVVNGLGTPCSPQGSVNVAPCLPRHVQERGSALHADTCDQKRAAGPRVLSARGDVYCWHVAACHGLRGLLQGTGCRGLRGTAHPHTFSSCPRCRCSVPPEWAGSAIQGARRVCKVPRV